MPPKRGKAAAKKGKAKVVEDVPVVVEQEAPSTAMDMDQPEAAPEPPAQVVEEQAQEQEQEDTTMQLDLQPSTSTSARASPKPGMTMQERAQKLASLRQKMRDTASANRRDLIEESNRAKLTAKELARIEKQRRLAETLREKVEAEETGEDLERKRNWEYSIEENDNWTKRLEKKARNADYEFHDETKTAHRKYKKDLDFLKPNMLSYAKQKEVALGLESGTLVKTDENGRVIHTDISSLASTSGNGASGSAEGSAAAELLYRDANSLLYADSKPSEEAIDRVVNKLNQDLDKRSKWSRRRPNEDEGDVTYINQRNKVFNKKIARFYDKYTTEIRASFERGTAV